MVAESKPEEDRPVQNGDHSVASKKKEDTGLSKPILRYDQYWDLRTYSWKLRKSAKPERKLSNKNPVLLVRRRIDDKGRHFDTQVDIKSPFLAQALIEINEGVEGLKLKRSPPEADPKLFYHSYEGLKLRLAKESAHSQPDAELVSHLSTAVQFTEEEHASSVASIGTLIPHDEITWDLLWAIFTPNTLVYHYHRITEQSQILLIRKTAYERRTDGSKYLQIDCDIVTDDGDSFGYAKALGHEIDEYEGSNKIQDLPIYPFRFHLDRAEVLGQAVRRAKVFCAMIGHTYQEISGAAMREIVSQEHKTKQLKFHTYGRLMVDPKGFRSFVPTATYNLPVYRRLDRRSLTDEQLAICNPVVLGFCFGVKMWGGFALDRCSDIQWGNEAFPSLVLSQPKKDLVYALVKQHNAKAKIFDDIVQGKGKGLIGLLSGRPGCGKTLTAEAVSEITRQPLYTVSAGELGTLPRELDEKLTMILELSHTWNAILLLDEADVFLQARDNLDVNRNALVSIFLRQLEYYHGILILTTNRIGSCDPAFESRIQFSFHYPDLDIESRKQIWTLFWKKSLRTNDIQKVIDEDGIASLAEHELNGRQIKNMVSSAISLALEEGVPLSKKHVETVLHVVQTWNNAVA